MSQIKVLLVDDDQDIITALTAILQPKGYEVVSAYNIKDGFELLTKSNPDIAVLDVMMDDKHDGFELARKIKKTDGFENLPIIMLTSISEVTGVNFSAAASDPDWLPVEEYIDKPVEPDKLISTIEELLAED